METEKKILSSPWVLRMGKRWFLATKDAQGRWVKDYANLNRIKDLAERRAAAERLLSSRNGQPAQELTEGALSALAKDWITTRHSDRANTNEARQTAARTFEREMRLAKLTYQTVDETFAWAYSRKYNSHYVTTARTLLRLAIKAGLRPSPSPFAEVKKVEDHEPATLVPVALQGELLARIRARDAKVWLMCQLQYYTFIRPVEQVRLELCDIDLAARQITVPGTKSKNRRGHKVVIPEPLLPILTDWLATTRSGQRWLFEHAGKPYCGHDSFRIHHQQVVAGMSSLPAGVKLYSWKHCGAVAACRAGVPLRQLQMQLRHKSLDQMLAYLRQQGVEDMGAVLKGW